MANNVTNAAKTIELTGGKGEELKQVNRIEVGDTFRKLSEEIGLNESIRRKRMEIDLLNKDIEESKQKKEEVANEIENMVFTSYANEHTLKVQVQNLLTMLSVKEKEIEALKQEHELELREVNGRLIESHREARRLNKKLQGYISIKTFISCILGGILATIVMVGGFDFLALWTLLFG
jgi:predicted PurR-regulated permease PerM